MRKFTFLKSMLAVALLCGTVSVQADVLYSTGFEDDFGAKFTNGTNVRTEDGVEWTFNNGDALSSNNPLTGGASALLRIKKNDIEGASMISDVLTPASASVQSIKFNCRNISTAIVTLYVYASTDNGATWLPIDTLGKAATGTTKASEEIPVDLSGTISLKFTISADGTTKSDRDVLIDDLEIIGTATSITLDQTDDNSTIAAATGVNVLFKRPLSTNWNTLCVPFGMTAEQISRTFGEGTLVADYTSLVGSTMQFTQATTIAANTPCLIKVAAAKDEWVIKNVDVVSGGAGSVSHSDGSSTVEMIGAYKPTTLTEGWYFISGNVFYQATAATQQMNGFRAYMVPSGTASVKAFSVNIDGETTAIDGINADDNAIAGNIYTLGGQLVRKNATSTNGLAKGIYIMNGKKVIVK